MGRQQVKTEEQSVLYERGWVKCPQGFAVKAVHYSFHHKVKAHSSSEHTHFFVISQRLSMFISVIFVQLILVIGFCFKRHIMFPLQMYIRYVYLFKL